MSEASSANEYTHEEQKAALDEVFDSLWFPSGEVRRNVYISYKMNMFLLVQYAISNGIDVLEHIRSIKQVLLKDGTAYEY